MDAHRWQEIQATFDTLVDLDGAERGVRLTALGVSDPELCAAVESLLAADAAADARLAPLEAALLPQSVPTPDPLGLVGQTISHFRLREPIGAGGMGVVYRADDTSLGRAVALKFLLPPYYLDASAKARFVREAHSAAALDHPNLCAIYEVGSAADGRLFLAMPLYPGETLKARLTRDGAMSAGEALAIARQVAAGLEGAHAAGIVHRDLKPANVMLLPEGGVKILDFGLAKARDQSLSEPGARVGTVCYMAPEQIRGDPVDPRADLWAVGAVLYEMLTGRRPFGGGQDIAVAHAILRSEPAPPSEQRPEVAPALDDLVLRLLQKDPARRHASASELLADLARVGAATDETPRSLRRRLRRAGRAASTNRRLLLAAGGALVAAAVGHAAFVRSARIPAVAPPRTGIAVLPFRDLSADRADAFFAGGLHDEILTQLHRVPALKVIGRQSVMSYAARSTPGLSEIARDLGVGSVVEGSVQVVRGRVRVSVQLTDALTGTPLWVERYDRTLLDAFALQSDIAQQIVATVGAALSSAQRNGMVKVPTAKSEAYLLYLRGREYQLRPGLLRENFQRAQQLYEQALALDPDFALAHASLARVHGYMYWLRYDMTPTRLAREREEADAALRLAPDLPQAHVARAHVYAHGPADSRAALGELRIAARIAPNDPDVWQWIAQAHRRLGEWEQFAAPFEKAVALDPRNANLLWDQGGGTYRRMGRYAEAVRWYDRALSVAPGLTAAALARAWVYFAWQGQLDSVRTVLRTLSDDRSLSEGQSTTSHHARRLLLERKPDSLLQLLAATRVPVFQSVADFDPAPLYAGWAHQLRGDGPAAQRAFDSALVVLDSAVRRFPEDWPVHRARGMALAGLRRRDEAMQEVRWLRGSLIYRNDAFLRPAVAAGAAKILAQIGDADASLDLMQQLLEDPAPGTSVHYLRLDPVWDPLREHPRFRALLEKHRDAGRLTTATRNPS